MGGFALSPLKGISILRQSCTNKQPWSCGCLLSRTIIPGLSHSRWSLSVAGWLSSSAMHLLLFLCVVSDSPSILVAPRWSMVAFLWRHVSSCWNLSSLLPLWSQDCRFCSWGQIGFTICVFPILLGSRLFGALKDRGLAPIRRSIGRFALSVRSWTLNWALMIGAWVKIS